MTTESFIDGQWVASGQTYDNVDPSTGEVIGQVVRCGKREVDAAVDAAQRAGPAWAQESPERRSQLLRALANAVGANAAELARMETEDTGKPLSQARTDAAVCARYFDFYASAIESYYGQTIPHTSDLVVQVERVPFGVVGQVVAWNYPMQLFSRSVAAAVATGNTTVLKPGDETPRTSVRIAQLALEAGFPRGVVNVVTGLGPEAGAALVGHPKVRHLSFVGSAPVGASIARTAADRVVPTVLELGGKSAHVVMDDADLDLAIGYITNGIVQNAGQTCSAGSRVIVSRAIHRELVSRLVERFARVSLGRGIEDKDLGPLISRKQQARVAGFLESLTQGDVLVGGKAPAGLGLPDGGAYFLPTLVDGVDPASRIAQEEVFGPVLVVMPCDGEDEAVALANGTEYALMAAVWTRDIGRAYRLSRRLEAGQVYVNAFGAGGGVKYPFGGFRKSGYGREKGYEALDSYTQSKTTIIKI